MPKEDNVSKENTRTRRTCRSNERGHETQRIRLDASLRALATNATKLDATNTPVARGQGADRAMAGQEQSGRGMGLPVVRRRGIGNARARDWQHKGKGQAARGKG
jgi:hypothetical protein